MFLDTMQILRSQKRISLVNEVHVNIELAGGFKPFEKYKSKLESSPSSGENNKINKYI